MSQLLRLSIFVLTLSVSVGAQVLPNGNEPRTRWLLDFETGSNAGLGYKDPHTAIGISFERSMMQQHLEFLSQASYSPDKKAISNDGNTLTLSVTGLVWVSNQFAVTSSLRRATLWTSQFEKRSVAPTVGFAVRENVFGVPGRFYFDYLFPTGCQWGASCPIQSSRIQGPEGYWEHRMWPHFRLGLKFGYYRFLAQGNPLMPDIPRIVKSSGEVHVLMRYEITRGGLNAPY